MKDILNKLTEHRCLSRDEARAIDTEVVMNNNFAFGGVNTSLIFKRWRE